MLKSSDTRDLSEHVHLPYKSLLTQSEVVDLSWSEAMAECNRTRAFIYQTAGPRMVTSWPGLRMIPEATSENKRQQFSRWEDQVQQASLEHHALLLCALSNDWEWFLREDPRLSDSPLLELDPQGAWIWIQTSPEIRSSFDVRKQHLLTQRAYEVLKCRLERYIAVLQGVFSKSHTLIVYHTSVLERMYCGAEYESLPILWAAWNSMLRSTLRAASDCGRVVNADGYPVEIRWINWASQFFCTEENEVYTLYRRNEWNSTSWVHRSPASMSELWYLAGDVILRHLKRIGCPISKSQCRLRQCE